MPVNTRILTIRVCCLSSGQQIVELFATAHSFCVFSSVLPQKRNSGKRRRSSARRPSQSAWNLWPRLLSQSEPITSPGAMTLTASSSRRRYRTNRPPSRPRPSRLLRSPSPSSPWCLWSLPRPRSRPSRSPRPSQRLPLHWMAPRLPRTPPLPLSHSSSSISSSRRFPLTCSVAPR